MSGIVLSSSVRQNLISLQSTALLATTQSDIPRYRASYLGLVKDLRETIPEFLDPIDTVSDHVSGGSLYAGLKEIRKLMKREEYLLTIDA